MGGRYVVTAGYVTVETAVSERSRAYIDIRQGVLLPADVSQEDVDRLLGRGDIAVAVGSFPDADVSGPAASAVGGPGAADGTVAEILARVGDDPALAREALDAERAKGDDARSTLVAALEKVAGPAGPVE